MDKDRPLHNLPLLFEQLGAFFDRLEVLQGRWPASKPEVESLFKRDSPSEVDIARGNFQKILDIIYDATAQGCSGGSTKMGR